MSLTLLFAGTGTAGDGPVGTFLVSIALSPSPGAMYLADAKSLLMSPGIGAIFLV